MSAAFNRIVRNAATGAIVDIPLANGCFHGLHATMPSLVCLTGSFRPRLALDYRERLLQKLVSALLTCGTYRRDQYEIADLLESRGALLSIESGLHRVSFFARGCSSDLPLIVELLGECLSEPRFADDVFATEQARLIAELQQSATHTPLLAADALSRLLYSPGHPRHQPAVAEQIALLQSLSVEQVRCYHRECFAVDDLHVVVVGDIDPAVAASQVGCSFAGWGGPRGAVTKPSEEDRPGAAGGSVVKIPLPGRDNFDIVLAQKLQVLRDDQDYLALLAADHTLGASFSSRLVTAVREEQGLTYAIRSELVEPDDSCLAHWQVTLSLSPECLNAGLAATRKEIVDFSAQGVTEGDLAIKRTELIGRFQMAMATLGGLSQMVLHGVERGYSSQYIHDFPAWLQSLTAAQVNRAIGEHLRPEQWHTVIAGPC
jgi:zinc protease